MNKGGFYACGRRWKLAVGSSATALIMAGASPAAAQCSPDPTIASGTTNCTGSDSDGIRVTTAGTALTVAQGANVTASGAPAIGVDVLRNNYTYSVANTIDVFGGVSAAGQNAIAVMSGTLASPSYSGTQQIALTVEAGGSVSGATALALLPSPGNANGTIYAIVDNAGTLTGTGGIALLGNATANNNGYNYSIASFSTITNRASGAIVGGILGPVGTLNNVGSIDGGTTSAVNLGSGSYTVVTNSAGGAIRSASNAATILDPANSLRVTNAGKIANESSGLALSAETLTIVNSAGGQISSAGSTAINASSINLVNSGTVTGDVAATSGANTIDSTAGRIEGSVTLGNGNNTLVAVYVGSRTLATGVTGTITATGTNNVERVVFSEDTAIATPTDLSAGFQQLVLAPVSGVTATLQNGFSSAATLILGGSGTVVNQTAINLAGQVIKDVGYSYYDTAGSFRNEGIIAGTSVAADQAAVQLGGTNFVNASGGTVTSNAGGIVMFSGTLTNAGTVVASNTAVSTPSAVLNNSGTIISTNGIGVALSGYQASSNSGSIRGATIGASVVTTLNNSGTISSAGLGVQLVSGYFVNASQGVVNGGTGGAVTAYYGTGIANAGTINGNVSVDTAGTYIALAGGVLNGDLALGAGATLVTSIVNSPPDQFAGITGR